MPAETLFRIDQSRNMRRYYRMDVQPTLFGEWELIREWGRVGQAGTVRCAAYMTAKAAELAREQRRHSKLKRGYQPAGAARSH